MVAFFQTTTLIQRLGPAAAFAAAAIGTVIVLWAPFCVSSTDSCAAGVRHGTKIDVSSLHYYYDDCYYYYYYYYYYYWWW